MSAVVDHDIAVLDSAPALAAWLHQRGVQALCADSRQLQPGMAFVAWPGFVRDGRAHVPAAFEAGARACVVEQAQLAQAVAQWPRDAHIPPGAVACMPSLKAVAGAVAAAFYAHPSLALPVVAITGTNGKTSSAWWLAQALTHVGRPCGIVGTLGVGLPAVDWHTTGLTTPDPITLQHTLRQWVNRGVQACALEASSIGLEEQRLAGLHVRVAVFTNFTQDHLDYHGTMAAYWQAKRRLFDAPGLSAVVINTDDPQGQALAQELRATRPELDVWTLGLRAEAGGDDAQHPPAPAPLPRLSATCTPTPTGQRLCLSEQAPLTTSSAMSAMSAVLDLPFVGRYNASNLLGVIASLRALGVDWCDAVAACTHLSPVPGRMEAVSWPQDPLPVETPPPPLVLVDYAHTPDALNQVLGALMPVARLRQGRLHVVVGCGGERDALKRPLMAAVAEQRADAVWLTSDNPRSEPPLSILAHMVAGLREPQRVPVIPDRGAAIAAALAAAAPNDVVLIAGKGHETTQDIAGVKHPFSDVVHAQQAWMSLQPPPAGRRS